jgi:antitoxin MazE
MKAKLIPVGNSKGIRLPKAILEAVRLRDAVTLRVEEGKLIITPAKRRPQPRQGWAEAIRAEIARSGAAEVDPDWDRLTNTWDAEDWR